MAEPVTNLTALWVQDEGIQLSWTAAPDVTTESSYEIYALQNQPIVDFAINYVYVEFTEVSPSLVRLNGQANYTLQEPVTTATFPWSSVLTLGGGNNAPSAVTIAVVHTDSAKNHSAYTTVTSYRPKIASDFSVPHLQTLMTFDPNYGNVITNEQDSNIEVTSSVEFLLGSVKGQRSASPNYGIEDIPLSQINTSDIQSAISRYEPRAKTTVSILYDNYNNATLNVSVQNQNNGGAQ
jgi:phage baseplate assembly protein W